MDDFQDAYQLASKWQRFGNLAIDSIALYLFYFVLMFLAAIVGLITLENAESIWVSLSAYPVYFLYYFVFELALGKTVGKMITGTKVVREDGGKPNWKQVAGRTLSRFVPFEFISMLVYTDPIGWHDQWPKTRVIKNR